MGSWMYAIWPCVSDGIDRLIPLTGSHCIDAAEFDK